MESVTEILGLQGFQLLGLRGEGSRWVIEAQRAATTISSHSSA